MNRSTAPRARRNRHAPHAVAGVEQHAKADRHALVGELRDRLRHAVLEDFEVVLGEVRNEAPVRVGHGDGDENGCRAPTRKICVCAATEAHEDPATATKDAKITKQFLVVRNIVESLRVLRDLRG